MIDTLDRMMGELQLLKEQTLTASRPTPPFPNSAPSFRFEHPPIIPQHLKPPWQEQFSASAYPSFQSQAPTNIWSQQPVAEVSRPITTSSQYKPHPSPAYQPPHVMAQEKTYRGPTPSIPDLIKKDPSEFARLKIALDNLLPPDGTELFKFQILMDHLKLDEARLIADAYLNSPSPYTDTMAALSEKFGQPHQLALRKIAGVMDAPDIRRGDVEAFERFALQIRALVGMLKTLGPDGEVELKCGSHVARLLSKLPAEMRSEFRRHMCRHPGVVYNLTDFSDWLQLETWCQDSSTQLGATGQKERVIQKPERLREAKSVKRMATILHGSENLPTKEPVESVSSKPAVHSKKKGPLKAYCPYCDTEDHYLSQCPIFQSFDKAQIIDWIKTNQRCWRCGRSHQAAQCNLKKACSLCQGKHLQILHEVNAKSVKEGTCLVSSATEILHLDKPSDSTRVLLKVIRVLLRNGDKTLDTYAILDDGSDRTMLLSSAAQQLGLTGTPEDLALRTIRQDIQTLHGACVSFTLSPIMQPQKSFHIANAFTAQRLGLAEHSYPVTMLKRRYRHLTDLPLQTFSRVSPLLLIGADHPHLINPIEPVRFGSPGGPAAMRTRLGWTLQGPAKSLESQLESQQCLYTSCSPLSVELQRNVEKLWQVDVLPYKSEKEVTRSKEDHEALQILEARTRRVDVKGVLRYATPLLRRKDAPLFQATQEATLPSLRSMERRLSKDPVRAAAYMDEIERLVTSGFVAKLQPEVASQSQESWYIPHHMVQHNGKNRVVFNCSFRHKGLNLNESLLPGPVLSPSLVGVLLRFREHSIAISGDIKGMFHQVCLLPEDKPLLRFLWRNMNRDEPPHSYEWQVLPFGTTCSPCCASFALQRHVLLHSEPGEEVRFSIERCFYVDNCLQSVSSIEEAQQLVKKLRQLLASGGFEIRQWASNRPEVISHLPSKARSDKLELWLSQDRQEAHESTLGLNWNCETDTLSLKHRPIDYGEPTMRNIYRTLASQYDPLGFIIPFTTRAKIIVQQLWDKHRDWDDPQLPHDLLHQWKTWKGELVHLSELTLPRCYTLPHMDLSDIAREVHIFCDASERAYGSVAYLRSEDHYGNAQLSFLMARSRVAPRKQISIPRLELCAALTGAQLAKLLQTELTFKVTTCTLWSDSTTVLNWLHSTSCHFKVFVGTRITEIQELTNPKDWRYVDSTRNPADDITRGKSLTELASPNRWTQGPDFLLLPPDQWPSCPSLGASDPEDGIELKRSAICHMANTTPGNQTPEAQRFNTWAELVEATAKEIQNAAMQGDPAGSNSPTAGAYTEAEQQILRQIQMDCFPEDYHLLQAGKPIPANSRLLCLAPQYDANHRLIRVGGRLRRAESLDLSVVHPVVLDPTHVYTRLLIQDVDARLGHPGPERVFAELRRTVWILRGREAVKRHQHSCMDCRRWRANPASQQMADLPPARLRLFKPAFYSTGMDCFGPFWIKIGRRREKRWGILFKCLTTRAVHIDLLTSIDTDSFLMAFRRFIARRGKPAEVYSDQGTNFKGGEKELQQAFSIMSPDLQQKLAKQQVRFRFNPPAAPHFGGTWEREIRSIKNALYTSVGSQTVSEEVLRTVLTEIEGILNAKPLGYVSADVADIDPVTPNYLLMGRPDSSLPQVVYPEEEALGRRRWRHSQILVDRFWSSFIRHYLPNLQTRMKWQRPMEDITEGAVVLLVDPQLPRASWQIGRVTKILTGSDGHTRTAEVKIRDKTYTRPIVRLIVLPAIKDEDDQVGEPSSV